ncbi:HEAT repeat domain-containing protein [Metabacillus litoralis]|uniref:HEAT repeat domain-containing protein n=1 Tax=Metabacillus litoralis TaxID=152268 RepID=UPI002041FF95|nr:HEAT repeat domain-containing protein [Metabacillus litoralis]MCM3412925.1 HEAT repeat domain-containing protein [Metabacillus litoralis]
MLEISLVVLFILFLAMFFILISLFTYLLIIKHFHNQKRKKIDDLKETYRLDMFHFLQSGEEGSLQPDKTEEKFIALIELLNEYSNVLDSEDVKGKISGFANKHLTNYIKSELKQRRWSLRMNALYSIEDFYMNHFVGELHKLYAKKNVTRTEKFQMLNLFAKFHDDQIVYYLKNVDPAISNFTLLSILSLLKEEQFNELADDFGALSKQMQYMMIETIGKKQYLHHINLIQKLLENSDEELRIRALKAFANTGAPIDEAILSKFFESTSWQVRMMAAKVAGVRRLSPFKDRLVSLLSDREYVVRSEAAKAILQFKGGVDLLRKVVSESNDGFAKDMALEWLGKEGVEY